MMAEPTNSDLESLRAEVARLSKIVSAQSARAYSDVRERASSVMEAATPIARKAANVAPVSYTHLTLPTIYSV